MRPLERLNVRRPQSTSLGRRSHPGSRGLLVAQQKRPQPVGPRYNKCDSNYCLVLSVGAAMLLLSWPMSPMVELSLGVAEVLVSVGVAEVLVSVGV
jgi:hypothetical protein